MTAPLTADALRAALAEAGLPGAEVEPHDAGFLVRAGVMDALVRVPPGAWEAWPAQRVVDRLLTPADVLNADRFWSDVAAMVVIRHDAAARALALPTCAEVRALREAARLVLAADDLRTSGGTLAETIEARHEGEEALDRALAALRKVLPEKEDGRG